MKILVFFVSKLDLSDFYAFMFLYIYIHICIYLLNNVYIHIYTMHKQFTTFYDFIFYYIFYLDCPVTFRKIIYNVQILQYNAFIVAGE